MYALIEADFRQYYSIRLATLWSHEITIREVADLLSQLPDSSRYSKWIRDDAMDSNQHLELAILETLRLIAFDAQVSAGVAAQREYAKIARKRPEPIEIPKVRPVEKTVKKFATGAELKAMLGGELRASQVRISHSKECIDSKINELGKVPICGCPRE